MKGVIKERFPELWDIKPGRRMGFRLLVFRHLISWVVIRIQILYLSFYLISPRQTQLRPPVNNLFSTIPLGLQVFILVFGFMGILFLIMSVHFLVSYFSDLRSRAHSFLSQQSDIWFLSFPSPLLLSSQTIAVDRPKTMKNEI